MSRGVSRVSWWVCKGLVGLDRAADGATRPSSEMGGGLRRVASAMPSCVNRLGERAAMRAIWRRCRLWRRSGSSRPTGELGGDGVSGFERIGLLELVAEHQRL